MEATVFNVANYGAVANDGNDDLTAQKLINAIEEAGYEAKEATPEIS